jgi:hypothetical protein
MLFLTIMHHVAADAQPSCVCGQDKPAETPATLLPAQQVSCICIIKSKQTHPLPETWQGFLSWPVICCQLISTLCKQPAPRGTRQQQLL